MSSGLVDTFNPFLCQYIVTLSPVTEHSSTNDSLPVCIEMFWLLGGSTINGGAMKTSYTRYLQNNEKYLEEVGWVWE